MNAICTGLKTKHASVPLDNKRNGNKSMIKVFPSVSDHFINDDAVRLLAMRDFNFHTDLTMAIGRRKNNKCISHVQCRSIGYYKYWIRNKLPAVGTQTLLVKTVKELKCIAYVL